MFRIEDSSGRNPINDHSSVLCAWFRLGLAFGLFAAASAFVVIDWANRQWFDKSGVSNTRPFLPGRLKQSFETIEPNDPAPGPNDPAPGPNDPAPGPNDPAPGPNDPAPGPNDPAPGPNDPAPGPDDPAPGPNGPAAGPKGAAPGPNASASPKTRTNH